MEIRFLYGSAIIRCFHPKLNMCIELTTVQYKYNNFFTYVLSSFLFYYLLLIIRHINYLYKIVNVYASAYSYNCGYRK